MTAEHAARCRGSRCIVVNDAWRLLPWADVLYASDAAWWDISGPKWGEFKGERWSTDSRRRQDNDDKLACAYKHRLTLIPGKDADGFNLTPTHIHYGHNSGFQAINLAILFGAEVITLYGFDMHADGNKRHFFGDHPAGLGNGTNYAHFVGAFDTAARMLPPHIRIINATPGSALTCFERG